MPQQLNHECSRVMKISINSASCTQQKSSYSPTTPSSGQKPVLPKSSAPRKWTAPFPKMPQKQFNCIFVSSLLWHNKRHIFFLLTMLPEKKKKKPNDRDWRVVIYTHPSRPKAKIEAADILKLTCLCSHQLRCVCVLEVLAMRMSWFTGPMLWNNKFRQLIHSRAWNPEFC